MGVDGELTRQLQAGVRDAVGRRQKVTFSRAVQLEIKSDKTDTRVVAVTEHRLFILTAKLPLKIEQNVHLLDISQLQFKGPNRLQIGWQSKHCTLCWAGGSEADSASSRHFASVLTQLAAHIISSLSSLFPGVPPSKLISVLDVPEEAMTRISRSSSGIPGISLQDGGARATESEKPCGNFSAAYRCMCDYHGVEFMEDVAWDIDTIYLSHGSRELCLSDFDHLEGRNLIPIISALSHNCWFTKLNASSVKLNADSLNEILNVLKTNSTIEGLVMCNLNLRVDFIQKLAAAILSNPSSALNSLDLSGNPVEDKGIQHVTGLITKLPAGGPVQLNFSRCTITGKATNRIAESLVTNSNSQYTLRQLDLSENLLKADDLTHLHNLLAQPNAVTHLRLAGCECPLENLFGALLRGCTQNLEVLDLSGNVYGMKRSAGKDGVVPLAWKQFFASSASLRVVNFSNNRLPLEAVKSILLGIASNIALRDVELDLSVNALGSNAAYCQMLEVCLPNVNNISSLNLSDNGFENALSGIVIKLSQNRCIRRLAIGRNFTSIKPKHIPKVLDAIVQMIQEEESPIECLLLDDLHLKSDATILINALGSNGTLKEIDITGNQMGDTGARMLAKALQINKRLAVIHWDNNFTTPNGFHDISSALEKNYTLRKMPVPLNDASVALKMNAERTQNALKKIEELLQRNQMPRKFSADQAYRLQQGFLMSSIHQSLDRSLVRVQNTVSRLENLANHGTALSPQALDAVDRAKVLISESDAACQLLLHLQKVAELAEREGGTIDQQVVRLAEELKRTVDGQLQTNIESMLKCVQTLCPSLLAEHKDEKGAPLVSTDMLRCGSQMALSETFISALVVEQLGTDLSNKMTELNLAAAARLSDKVLDAVLESLDKCAVHLEALVKSHLASPDKVSSNPEADRHARGSAAPISDQMGGARTESVSASGDEDLDIPADMPEVMDKNATLRQRRRRPQSSIEAMMSLQRGRLNSPTSESGSRKELDDETTDESWSESSSSTAAAVASSAAAVSSPPQGRAGGQNGSTSTPTNIPARPPPSHRASPQGRRPPVNPACGGTGGNGSDLPVLSTEAPRLEHLGAGRPRRARNHAVTKPTVAPGDDLIGIRVEDESAFVQENGFAMEGATSRSTEAADSVSPSANQSSSTGSSAAGGHSGGKKVRIAAGFKSLFGKKSAGGSGPGPSPTASAVPPTFTKAPQEVQAKSSTLPSYSGASENPVSGGPSRGLVAGSEVPPAVLVSIERRLASSSETGEPRSTGGSGAVGRDDLEPVRKGPLPRPPPLVKKPESVAPAPPQGAGKSIAPAPPQGAGNISTGGAEAAKKLVGAVPLPFDRNQPLRKSTDELRRSPARYPESEPSEEFGSFERNTPFRKTSDMVLGGRNSTQQQKQTDLGGARERLTGEKAESGLKKTGSLKSGGGAPKRPAPPVAKAGGGGRRSLDELSISDKMDDTSAKSSLDAAAEEPKPKPRHFAAKAGLPAVNQSGSPGEAASDKARPAVKPRPPPPLAPKPTTGANKNRLSTVGALPAEHVGLSQKPESRDGVDGEETVSKSLPLDSNSNVKLASDTTPATASEECAAALTGDQSADDKRGSTLSASSENQSGGSIVDESSTGDQSAQSIPSESQSSEMGKSDLSDVVYV